MEKSKINIQKELNKILHGCKIPTIENIMFCLELKIYHTLSDIERELICKIFHRASGILNIESKFK